MVIQYYRTVYSEKRGRDCRFWFNAKRPGTNIWRINMTADYVPSQNFSTSEDPHEVMLKLIKEWENEL